MVRRSRRDVISRDADLVASPRRPRHGARDALGSPEVEEPRSGATALAILALVSGLLDRSRLARLGDVTFYDTVQALLAHGPTAETVLVDLEVPGALHALPGIRAMAGGRLVVYGPHVEREMLAAARQAGADAVLSRSRVFAPGGLDRVAGRQAERGC